jgi:acyl-coenzyme A thioesterase PaaI-like protein
MSAALKYIELENIRLDPKLMARLEGYRQAYLALTPPDNFDTPIYTSVEILSGTTNPNRTTGTATFRIAFSPKYCNKFGTVHGGAIATLLDGVAQCSTAVVDGGMSDAKTGSGKGKGRVGGGATKGLQISYLKPIRVGEAVRVVCEILKSGIGGATIRCTVTREGDGETLAVGVMEKESYERAKL